MRRAIPMRTIRPEIPIELEDLVRRLLAEKPDDRPKDAVFVYRSLLPYLPGNERIAVEQPQSLKITPSGPKRSKILVVDDAPTVRFVCMQTLQRSGFDVTEVADAGAAIEEITHNHYDIVLLDFQLPDLPGSEVLKKIREQPHCENVKVLMMSGVRDTTDIAPLRLLGADDFIGKPFTSAQLLTLVKANLNLKEKQENTEKTAKVMTSENAKLRQQLASMQTELVRTRDFLMQTVSELIGERNFISSTRALRLQRYCKAIALEAMHHNAFRNEINQEFIGMLETWVPLMDVGHLLLPDYLLLKPSELTTDERELMQAHTTLGADLLSRIASKQPGQMTFFQMAITICRYHHERWDGNGYPDKLIGVEVPLPARIATMADVYDALRSQRVYRAALSHSAAVRAILDDCPGQFDPNLLHAFSRCEHHFEQIFRELPE